MVHLQFPTLWTSNYLPILMRLLNHIHFWLRCILCLQWLTHSILYSCSLSLSCPQTKCTLNSNGNAHWLGNLEKDSSTVVQRAGPLRKMLQLVKIIFPSGSTECKTQTITTTSYSNSLQCISLSSFVLLFFIKIGKIQNNFVHCSNSFI